MPSITELFTEVRSRLPGPDATREAEWLLEAICRINRTRLFSRPDDLVDDALIQQLNAAIEKRQAGEPLAYILGQREFWSMNLSVTPEVLIPQPDTEVLVEQSLARIPANGTWRIADLGTGSGAVALAIARERPLCEVIATDRSGAALSVAAGNANSCQADNVCFLQANWLGPFNKQSLDMIVSNPPYVADSDPCLQSGDVSREPREALAAGPLGLDDLQTIISSSARVLKPRGWLVLTR